MAELLRTTWLLFRMQLSMVMRSRRMLIAILLAAIPPLIAFIVATFAPSDVKPGEILANISYWLNLQVIVPILALVAGSAVVTEEFENRTITYLFTRPVPRPALLFGRLLATMVLVWALLGSSAIGIALAAGQRAGEMPEGLALRVFAANIAGGTVYSIVFATIGVFLRHPMIVGLGYTFAFEMAVANVPGGSQSLTIQYHLRSILVDATEACWQRAEILFLDAFSTPAEAITTLAIVAVVALVIGAAGISRRQYVLTA
jgi:ABC-2 type transport system permease protein